MKNAIEVYIQAAKEGDQTAFTYLLNHYWSEVYFYTLKQVENEADAEDITIETFSKAFSNITRYNPDFAFNTWIISIAKNVHIDMLRKRKKNILYTFDDDAQNEYKDIADDSPTIEDKIIQKQNLQVFEAYIRLLKPHYQEVIFMRYFQDMSYNEIAEALNEPLNNIKVKIMRAKKLLSEIIIKQIDNKFKL